MTLTRRKMLAIGLGAAFSFGGISVMSPTDPRSKTDDLFDVSVERVGNGPVLDRSTDEWDAHRVGDPVVVHDGDEFHALYDGDGPAHFDIGHATSPDLIHWSKNSDNPVIDGTAPDSWDYFRTVDPGVIIENGRQYMFYSGKSTDASQQIGLAVSDDWTTWYKHQKNPIILHGHSGTWKQNNVANACVRKYDGRYHMLFQGNYHPPGERDTQVGYARSKDLINWHLHPQNPVLPTSSPTAPDDHYVAGPTFHRVEDRYHVFYASQKHGDEYRTLSHAVSDDLVDWTRNPGNPVLNPGASGSWDDFMVSNPTLVQDPSDASWFLLYSGVDDATRTMEIGLSRVSF